MVLELKNRINLRRGVKVESREPRTASKRQEKVYVLPQKTARQGSRKIDSSSGNPENCEGGISMHSTL